jgi:hypothetical protein
MSSDFTKTLLSLVLLYFSIHMQASARENESAISTKIEVFIHNLLQADADRNLKKLSAFYMPLIKYNGEVASKDDFLSETQAFYKIWPTAKWKIIDQPIIETDINDMHTVNYKAAFRLENENKGIYSEGILASNLLIVTTAEGKLRIQTVSNDVYNSKNGSISRNIEIDTNSRVENPHQETRAVRSKRPVPLNNVYGEIERIQSISNPNERANANINFWQGINQSLGNFIENNPKAFGGMSSDEFMLESLYNTAREEGLSPSEAQIEAQRNFRNLKRFMNQ